LETYHRIGSAEIKGMKMQIWLSGVEQESSNDIAMLELELYFSYSSFMSGFYDPADDPLPFAEGFQLLYEQMQRSPRDGIQVIA
jgi:hypothetical protein